MTLGDMARKAVAGDHVVAKRLVDYLQLKQGMDYKQILEWVNTVVPVNEAEWDQLMYRADMEEL